jgi:hypothetical protein
LPELTQPPAERPTESRKKGNIEHGISNYEVLQPFCIAVLELATKMEINSWL